MMYPAAGSKVQCRTWTNHRLLPEQQNGRFACGGLIQVSSLDTGSSISAAIHAFSKKQETQLESSVHEQQHVFRSQHAAAAVKEHVQSR